MKKQLLLATKNRHKLEELSHILAPLDWEVLTYEKEDYPDVPETGKTFDENSWIKARAMVEYTGKLCVADDSGLEIDALNGMPGVMSARFGGEGAGYGEKNSKVLSMMKDVPEEKRTARFICVASLVWPDRRTEFFRGICEGMIACSPSGNNGFGYDPIFYIPSMKSTMAELLPDIKNQISHRAIAFKKLADFLSKNKI
jgi:XTP/dITP diphosphohydrolase